MLCQTTVIANTARNAEPRIRAVIDILRTDTD